MIVNFLAAADGTPLTKVFASNFGTLTKSAYPNVRNFNSLSFPVSSLTEFYAAIVVNAEQNNCLVKGVLQRELTNESRQGATSTLSMTQWLVFDIDHLPGVTTADQVIALLPPEFQDVSYILQLSSSHGFEHNATDLRAHLFFMLSADVSPQAIKVWMKQLNLTHMGLATHIRLAEGGCTLKWPLDISVNQNDKLIYIAPPLCRDGLIDPVPLTDRIRLITKGHDTVDFNPVVNSEAVRSTELTKINELRAAAGLEKKRLKINVVDGINIISNADQMTLTAEPFVERGFVYLPISSNKYTYYHPEGRHDYLYTFKDPDVAYPMDTVLPSYYWHCERERRKTNSQSTNDHTIFTFRDARADTKYVGQYSNDLSLLEINGIKAREDIDDFFVQHGRTTPQLIETWTYEFDPTRTERISPQRRWVNKFIPTQYMLLEATTTTTMAPNIERLLKHIMNYDEECYAHFINWLAYKFQTRRKCKTAWFFQGVEGTGKGVLYNMVLAPLFGSNCCHLKRMENLLDRFNADLETSLLWVIDEANIENFKEDGQILEKLKNLIVEDTQIIRAMRTNQYSAVNYTDVLLFSNQSLAIRLSPTDRRYNIAPRQNIPLLNVMDRGTIRALRDELPQFATFLLSYDASEDLAQEPLTNQAKLDMIALSRTTHDEFFHCVLTGDLLYFLRAAEVQTSNPALIIDAQSLRATLTTIAHAALINPYQELSMQMLASMYSAIMKRETTVVKIARMLHLKGATLTTQTESSLEVLPVTWNVDELAVRRWLSPQSPQNPRSPHGEQTRQAPH